MHGHTDRASLVGNSTRHSLTDPPCGIGREFVPTPVIELLGCADQADVALLDQVQEGDTASHIFLGYRNDQTGVRRDQMFTSSPTVFDQLAKFRTTARAGVPFGKLFARHASAFDTLR